MVVVMMVMAATIPMMVVVMMVMVLSHLHFAADGRIDLPVVDHFQNGGGIGNGLQEFVKRPGLHHLVDVGGRRLRLRRA